MTAAAVQASRSTLPRRETLGTVPDNQHVIHAAYPSATHTLCCLPTLGGDPGGPSPTCPVCTETAALWNTIDQEGG